MKGLCVTAKSAARLPQRVMPRTKQPDRPGSMSAGPPGAAEFYAPQRTPLCATSRRPIISVVGPAQLVDNYSDKCLGCEGPPPACTKMLCSERSLWLNRRGPIKAQCPRASDKQSGKEYTFRVRPADILTPRPQRCRKHLKSQSTESA